MIEHDPSKRTIFQAIEIEETYEVIARQEEVYLEETEEELRMILIFGDPLTTPDSKLGARHMQAENSGNELLYAAEDLVVGDSDDAPLSEETVREMLQDISRDFNR